MNCPNCGSPLADGSLYCEKCGTEIQIVPEFEPELEDTCQKTLDQISNTIWKRENQKEKQESDSSNHPSFSKLLSKDELNAKRKHRIWYSVVLIIGILLIACTAYLSVKLSSPKDDNLLEQARTAAATADFQKAASIYEQLLRNSPDSPILMKELAAVYHAEGEDILYENMLLSILKLPDITEEQCIQTYQELIDIYISCKDYQSVRELLTESFSEDIRNHFAYYLGIQPAMNLADGVYDLPQLLVLSTPETAVIYYTLDGSIPTVNSNVYVQPIFLSEGEYTLQAFAVMENGIIGDTVSAHYQISVQSLAQPDIIPYSGTFTSPENIVLQDEEENITIYYTMDGSKPNEESSVMSGPIPIPIGKSLFKFMAVDSEGRASEVSERSYQLNLQTDISVDDACVLLMTNLIQNGRIIDWTGISQNPDIILSYTCNTAVLKEDDQSIYYLFREYENMSDGTSRYSGIDFGVNIADGSILNLSEMNE